MIAIRLFGLVGALISAGITYYNWMQFNPERTYSMRAAVIAPAFVVLCLLIFLFPKYMKPETTIDKIVVLFFFMLGVAAGVYNLYLMNPSMFGQ
ncbi:MAG TPA: hypothetical protein DHW49_00435 [Anaerolineae bacterium]|nr:hypothetical protein [Anaerolineae bacterium]